MNKTISPPKKNIKNKNKNQKDNTGTYNKDKKTRNTNEILLKDMADLGPGSFQKDRRDKPR